MNSGKEKLALIDIGNSRLKIFYKNSLNSFAYSNAWHNKIENFLKNLVPIPNLVIISSVNSKIKEEISNILNKYLITIIDVKTFLKEQNLIDFSLVSGIGNDRELGLFGALSYIKPPFITVDCGTAVTINIVNSDFKCLGGVIFADIYTQTKALAHNTADLNEVDLFFDDQIIGQTTEHALRIGIVNNVIYGIKGIVQKIIKDEFRNTAVPIILTGGSASIIAKGLTDWKYYYEIKENLVLDGLSFLYDLIYKMRT